MACDTLGARLAAARCDRGLTRVELARIVECSESYLSYLETGARSPSDRLLTALAEAVRREPEWLRSGEDSPETQRIAEELRLAWEAFRAADWERVDEHVARLLTDDPGQASRPLRPPERESVVLLRGRSLGATGREQEAIDLLTPLVRRVLAGLSEVSPVVLGQGYVRALLNAADGNIDTLARASIVGQQLLTAAGDERDDDWWRLAATLMGIHYRVSPSNLAAAQGEWWLSELQQDGEMAHPCGAAALYWNLAVTDLDLGRHDAAVTKILTAVSLQDPTRYPSDGATIRLVLAHVLLAARPDRVEEAISELEGCRTQPARHGYPGTLGSWILVRARAEAVAGRAEGALQTLGTLLEDPQADLQLRVTGWLMHGDLCKHLDRPDDADRAYRMGASLLDGAPATPSWSRTWRDLGDRWTAIGDDRAAAGAYRRALDLMHLSPSPELGWRSQI
jgi:transcriptional regulator with XRE-family HTH domain